MSYSRNSVIAFFFAEIVNVNGIIFLIGCENEKEESCFFNRRSSELSDSFWNLFFLHG